MTPTLTTDQHLDLILAKCRVILELAERRTPGKWESVDPGPLRQCRRLFAEHRYVGTIDNSDGHDTHSHDADFIAACAGRTEAACRSTIAAIEGLRMLLAHYSLTSPYLSIGAHAQLEVQLATIRSAWPIELLQ